MYDYEHELNLFTQSTIVKVKQSPGAWKAYFRIHPSLEMIIEK